MSEFDPSVIDLSDRRRWLAVGQAATVTRTSERTIWRWAAQGRITVVTTAGGRTYVDRTTLFQPAATPDLSVIDRP